MSLPCGEKFISKLEMPPALDQKSARRCQNPQGRAAGSTFATQRRPKRSIGGTLGALVLEFGDTGFVRITSLYYICFFFSLEGRSLASGQGGRSLKQQLPKTGSQDIHARGDVLSKDMTASEVVYYLL